MTDENQTNQKQQSNQQDKKQQPNYLVENSSIKITIPWKKVEPVYQKVIANQRQQIKVKGFRKGKAPAAKVEEEVGLPKLFNLTLQQILPKVYRKTIEGSDKQPITQPEFQMLNVNKGNDWVIKANFAEKPEIKLNNYQKIVKQAKKQAEKNIEQAEKAAEESVKQDKDQADKTTKQKQDKKDKTAKQKGQADKTGEQAEQGLGESQKKDITLQTIFSQLITELEPKIPEILVKQNTRRELDNIQKRLDKLNVNMGDYLQSQNMTQQQLTTRLVQSSLNQLQVEFLLNAIAEKEDIVVSDQAVEERIEQVEDDKTKDRMKQDHHYQNYLRSVLLKQKVIDYLLEL